MEKSEVLIAWEAGVTAFNDPSFAGVIAFEVAAGAMMRELREKDP